NRQRGVDGDDVDRPEARRQDASVDGPDAKKNTSQKQALSHREARYLRESTLSARSDSPLSELDDKPAQNPGAVAIAGTPFLSEEGDSSTPPTESNTIESDFITAIPSHEETIIAARLVEDIEIQDKDLIRQEIYDEAEKAEIVDVKRHRKRLVFSACVCFLIVAGLAVGLGLYLGKIRKEEVNNSVCGNSLPLLLGDIISGRVGNADVSSIDTCGPTPPVGDVKGRWFSFLGDGNSIIASTCLNTNFDSQISVFTGSVIYYVFVHGTNVSPDAQFELSLLSSAGAVANDSCETAVNTASFSGVSIQGSTDFAAFSSVPVCGGIIANGAAGAWYQVRGTGDIMVASTCDSTGTLQDSQISVFQGQCGGLQCIEGSDNACGDTMSSAAWQSVAGTSYYIYVHGKDSQKGTFDMKIETFGNQNDIDEQCQEATTDFYNSGILAELEQLTSSMFGALDSDKLGAIFKFVVPLNSCCFGKDHDLAVVTFRRRFWYSFLFEDDAVALQLLAVELANVVLRILDVVPW
ncbi:MAG: hypothetical protein SGILL_002481, partial [Bacillariaceae sp.]